MFFSSRMLKTKHTNKMKTETEIIIILENLVHNRFSLESLNKHLQKEFDLKKPLIIEDVTNIKDECDKSDFNLMLCLDTKDIFCDIDIYFLLLRSTDDNNNTIYITEVNYEFQ